MKTRRVLAYSGVVLIAVAVAFAVVFWDYDTEETKRVMLTTAHDCPPGTNEKIERAGETGWLRVCQKNGARHGPFVYWKKRHKYAEGNYADGRHAGPVRYFDENGQVARIDGNPK